MTVKEFVDLVKDDPEIMAAKFGHSPYNGLELPCEAFQIYWDVMDNGQPCVTMSGGGYPYRLKPLRMIK